MATIKPDEELVAQLEARLRHLGATLDDLVAKSEAEGRALDAKYAKGIEELRAHLASAQSHLTTLREQGNSDWHTVMEGVEEAWLELEAAFRKAAGE
ncbi:MAG: hypothetical protein EA398_07695 [Deltaproteobacteria bacterium]|nr:MAG: hypothetical protein EA398_07695 [Deltaproteobacteria bacterium]